MDQISNIRVVGFEALPEPRLMRQELALSQACQEHIVTSRQAIRRAIAGEDKRPVVICGPCSIHDPKAALEYATRLAELNQEVAQTLLIVMRVYFEKPRTTVGWKGLINDPRLDGTHDIATGLKMAREILLQINALGLPCASEFLDPVVPQYTADLVSWAAIGARTTESQTHREMASGLSMPVGFKNATDGGLQVALDAMQSAQAAHAFLGIGPDGRASVVRTTGNPDVHLVLRGGTSGPNHSRADTAYAQAKLEENHQKGRRVMIDCSHGNSNKDYKRQPEVFLSLIERLAGGEEHLLGMMLESNLVSGAQKLQKGTPPVYGQSITDGCIDWQTTKTLLLDAHTKLAKNKA